MYTINRLNWLLTTLLLVVPEVAATLPPAIPEGCPQIAPGPLQIQDVPSYFPPREAVNILDVEAIRRTLAFYALAIDGKSWDALGNVFADNAVANYSDPIGVLSGLLAIKSGLQPGLAQFAGTQHLLSTQIIDVCSHDSAVSVTYYTASHFLNTTSVPTSVTDDSQVYYAYGQYQDTWKKQDNKTWKIVYRNLVYMGPLISDVS